MLIEHITAIRKTWELSYNIIILIIRVTFYMKCISVKLPKKILLCFLLQLYIIFFCIKFIKMIL